MIKGLSWFLIYNSNKVTLVHTDDVVLLWQKRKKTIYKIHLSLKILKRVCRNNLQIYKSFQKYLYYFWGKIIPNDSVVDFFILFFILNNFDSCLHQRRPILKIQSCLENERQKTHYSCFLISKNIANFY